MREEGREEEEDESEEEEECLEELAVSRSFRACLWSSMKESCCSTTAWRQEGTVTHGHMIILHGTVK